MCLIEGNVKVLTLLIATQVVAKATLMIVDVAGAVAGAQRVQPCAQFRSAGSPPDGEPLHDSYLGPILPRCTRAFMSPGG